MFDDATVRAIESPFRTRMMHMAGHTEDYMPKPLINWFNEPSSKVAKATGFAGFRKTAGK